MLKSITLLYVPSIVLVLLTIHLSAMEIHPRGFKFRTALDRFAWDLWLMLGDMLTADSLDAEQLKLRVLMTLSDVDESEPRRRKHKSCSYVEELLFRDYSLASELVWHRFDLPATASQPSVTIRIHDEAITYLTGVLERRLTLAQNLMEKPTNVHVLFCSLANYSSLHADWRYAQCHRDRRVKASKAAPHVTACAGQLARQRSALGDAFGDISRRRREQYGPLWLTVGDCCQELPEEMSFFNALEALPLALTADFSQDSSIQKNLVRVLDSLNERYMLLRSVGLPPSEWLERSEPSIAVLKDLKHLRIEAEKLLQIGDIEPGKRTEAFRLVFTRRQQKEQRKKIAGCHDFDELSRTEYGRVLLKYAILSLDAAVTDTDDDYNGYENLAGSDFEAEQTSELFVRLSDDFDWIQYLLDDRADLFDETMALFFRLALAVEEPLSGAGENLTLLKNPQFMEQVRAHPEYGVLSSEALLERLLSEATAIVDRALAEASLEISAK